MEKGQKKREITNVRFGKLIALEETKEIRRGSRVWRCKCDCGREAFVERKSLGNSNTKSCGCLVATSGQARRRDLTNQKFGKLTAVRDIGKQDSKHSPRRLWKCNCDCGASIVVPSNDLISGNTKSCGCNRDKLHGPDLIEQKFGMLTVIRWAGALKDKNGQVAYGQSKSRTGVWECRCDCGQTTLISTTKLRNGGKKSCGCLKRVCGPALCHPEQPAVTRTGLCRLCKVRKMNLSKYGLTPESWERLLSEQHYCCRLCNVQFADNETPVVDHCHKTNKVRGLLHAKCNVLIGFADESETILASAIEYLRSVA